MSSFVLLSLAAHLASQAVGVLVLPILLLAPVPLALNFHWHGMRRGILGTLTGLGMGLLAGALLPGESSLVLHAVLAFTGGVFGYLWVRGWSWPSIVAAGSLGVGVILVMDFYGSPMVDVTRLAARELTEPTLNRPGPGTGPKAARPPAEALLEKLLAQTAAGVQKADQENLRWLMLWWLQCPIFIFAMAALSLFGGFAWVMSRVAGILGINGQPDSSFSSWRIPWGYSWAVILGAVPLCVSAQGGSLWWKTFATQLLLILLLPYLVVTLSMARYFLDRSGFPTVLKAVFYVVVLINLPYLMLLALMDPWIDFRRMSEAATEGSLDDSDDDTDSQE